MRDYAELVKGLRDCSRRNARVCMICGAKASNLCEGTKSKRMFYAADAIEELLAERDRYKSFFDRIKDLPDCNICLKKNRCEFEPRPGEHTRINCAFCLTAPPKEPAHE